LPNRPTLLEWGHVLSSMRGSAVEPLKLGYIEAALNNFELAITLPLVLPYAVSLGANGWQIGMITALPLLGMNLSQVPATRFGARFKNQAGYVLLAGGLGLAAWLALAVLLLAGHVSFVTLLAAATIASISSGMLMPMWTAFLGERVAEERRGSYFGTRNLLAGATALCGALAAASLGSSLGFGRGSGVALLMAVLAACGALAAQAVAVGRSPRRRFEAGSRTGALDPWEWRSPAVRGYVIYGALLILGAGMATPFYSMQFISGLGGAPQAATTAVAVANALVMLGQGLWGRVIDRYSLRLVGAASLAGIIVVPLLWLAARDPAHGVAIWVFNGSMWAACGLATFNLMLAVSNDHNRASVVAWVNTLQSPINFAAPLVGGFIAERAGLSILFAVASATLGVSWLCFLRCFTDTKPRSDRA
jgi:MFS family permease